jgi:hypothetical protein
MKNFQRWKIELEADYMKNELASIEKWKTASLKLNE